MANPQPVKPPQAGRSWAWNAVVAFAILLLIVFVFLPRMRETLPPDEFQPARLLGKPLRLAGADGDRIFLLSEQYGLHWFWGHGSGGRRWTSPASEQVLNYDLWAFEAGRAEPAWRRRFVDKPPDSMTSSGDLLLAQGGALRLQLGEPVRVSPADGRLLAPAAAAGPESRGGEVYDLRDLQARGLRVQDRWFGLLTATEHARLTGAGAEGWRPDALGPAGEPGEYAWWTARVRDRAEAWGRVGQYSGFRRIEAAPTFLHAGLLRPDARAEPLRVGGDVLVLHRESGSPGSRLVLTRLSLGDGVMAWTRALPIVSLKHLLPGEPHLALVGTEGKDAAGPDAKPPEWLVFIDLRDGKPGSFELGRASLGASPPPLP